MLWGERRLVKGKGYIVLENLSFRNSGVHGYQQGQAHDVVIRACDFRFIGGAVWDNDRRIRFGNAIELWDGARDITVEHCTFDNIYDAGVTHQGGETRRIPERLYFRYNYFSRCGFSAYECREPSQEIYFEYNVSVNAGGGFSPQGEAPPRQSEIYPQPVGHHVFIWKINPHTQPGRFIFDTIPSARRPLVPPSIPSFPPLTKKNLFSIITLISKPAATYSSTWAAGPIARRSLKFTKLNAGKIRIARSLSPNRWVDILSD